MSLHHFDQDDTHTSNLDGRNPVLDRGFTAPHKAAQIHCGTMYNDPSLGEGSDFLAQLRGMAQRKFDAIAADLDLLATDPDACERRAKALATVTLALDEISRALQPRDAGGHAAGLSDALVDEDDPRACPRDVGALRDALATALDRFNEKKNISNN